MHHILELLDRTSAAWPDALSFCDERTACTWAHTRQTVESVGTALALLPGGVLRRPVALYMERGADTLHAMLGVLAAGGFYTVLDTAQPPERVRAILEQLEPAAILTDADHADAARELAGAVPVVEYAAAASSSSHAEMITALREEVIDTDLAYVLFTSGSTGLPKGVAVTHRNVLAYSEWVVSAFGFSPRTVLGNQTPFYFSMSVTDLYGALRSGACVQVIPRRLFSFPVQLLEYLCSRSVNTLYWVPSALGIVANWKALDYTSAPPLQTILFAGEVMPAAKLNYWRGHYPAARFANLYGPTETTDICAFYELDREFRDDESLPIGRACRNCGLLVLCGDRPAAQGEAGELCVRGSFVAAGYYRQPEKTAQRFVQNPVQTACPEIIYRTGDLVRVNERGELIYCGRLDNQIKHMGYRIEPGEIETAAFGQDKLDECACLYDAARDQLVLFFQARKDVTESLRARLARLLPPYMQPARYQRVRQMPHNANGKVDRHALTALL